MDMNKDKIEDGVIMNTMTVKDALNLSHGSIEVRFFYDGENHFIWLLSDEIGKLKHCVNRVRSIRAVSYTLCIYAEGTPEFESDNIEEKIEKNLNNKELNVK